MKKHLFHKFTPQEIALNFITFLWGATFITTQHALSYVGVMFLVGTRFGLASIFSLFSSGSTILHTQPRDILLSTIIGITIFLGYGLQTVGLRYLTSSQSAFITTLYVPIVPCLQWFLTRKTPTPLTWLAITCSFLGLITLMGYQNFLTLHWGLGEICTCLSAIATASEIALLSYFAPLFHNGRNAATIQIAIAAILAYLTFPFLGEKWPHFSWQWALPITALAALSAFVQIVVNWAQKTVSPTHATLIYSAEPLWAGLIGWIIGEHFTMHFLLGAALIFGGVLLSELGPTNESKNGSHA